MGIVVFPKIGAVVLIRRLPKRRSDVLLIRSIAILVRKMLVAKLGSIVVTKVDKKL